MEMATAWPFLSSSMIYILISSPFLNYWMNTLMTPPAFKINHLF